MNNSDKSDKKRLRPREIAAGYSDGKTIDWVKSQCKKYDYPADVFKWVKNYITNGAGK